MTVEPFIRQLAEQHQVDLNPLQRPNLLKHLQSWEETLRSAYLVFRATSSDDQVFLQVGEWMLDNDYVVQQNLYLIQQDLPQRYFMQLPILTTTPLQGYPRVFSLAWEWVGYTQGQVESAQFEAFVQDYQQLTALTVGELWALPSMLRLAILEHLARAVAVIAGVPAPSDLNAKAILPSPWRGTPQAVVANSFASLGAISATDWHSFFERTSRVAQILRADPAGIYASMDVETRNRYCSVVDELSQHTSNLSQEAVAQAALEMAQAAQDKALSREAHIGFYLIDQGSAALQARVGYRPGWRARLRGWFLSHPTNLYLGRIALFSFIFMSGLLIYLAVAGVSLGQWILSILLGFGLALEAAIMEVQWDVTHKIVPQRLPRMDFSRGIASGNRTMVAVLTRLVSADEAASVLRSIEQHFLANADPQLTFALLTDFTDASSQVLPDDALLLAQLKNGIEALNGKYSHQPFYVFHRSRMWNESEGVWMGWERRRGALAAFNQLLLNGNTTPYLLMAGETAVLSEIKYVITLDVDTLLPQDSAIRLVAAFAHPLNHAQFAPDGRSVAAGYTILQPRIEIKPDSAKRSRFSRIFAGDSGVDLSTPPVSDVYQDLFGEGSFAGQGIYDVAAFEKSVHGQIPENTLLNASLLQGILGRTALVTDVVLYEDCPARYMDHVRRLKRWIRGDWQLLPWFLNRLPTVGGIPKNHISLINRWKVFDNLRRSLLPPTMMLILTCAWLGWLPGISVLWSLLVLVVPALNVMAQMLSQLRRDWQTPFKEILQTGWAGVWRWALSIAFLPYEAFLALGAIIVSLTRVFITRKHLLRYTTKAHAARMLMLNPRYEIQAEMAVSLIFVAVLALVTARVHPAALAATIPLLVLWGLSPQLAYWISQPVISISATLSVPQRQRLERLARRTWAYFEQHVGPDDHWLPLDHFQESPRSVVAHSTTPTNIGLLLLSTLSAHDLGYISVLDLAARLKATCNSLEQLEQYRGHFLHRYDTQTLAPLLPRYISTVDSGNLAASLIAFRQGCQTIKDASIFGAQQWDGLLVILDILTTILEKLQSATSDEFVEPFTIGLENIRERILAVRETPEAWTIVLTWLSGPGWETISRRLIQVFENPPSNLDQETLKELQLYLDLLHSQLLGMQKNIDLLAPWLSHLNQQPPALLTSPGGLLAENWQAFKKSIPDTLPTLSQAGFVYLNIKKAIGQLKTQLIHDTVLSEENQEAYYWCQKLDSELNSARMQVQMLLTNYADLAARALARLNAIDFKFLLHEQRQVFHTGYDLLEGKLDDRYHDLLASETRLASLIAIAKGDVSQNHWVHLRRAVTQVNNRQALLSWSGGMAAHLIPLLFTRNYEETFLQDSTFTVLDRHIGYGKEKNTPWGISESACYVFDVDMNYQYRAFGVPGLGYKRGLADDMVVAPYASVLGLSLQPQAVLENIEHFERLGILGRFGLYEALDYTKMRLSSGETFAVVQAYMAHHQGMVLMAASNYLLKDIMVERFHADERIQSIELLLQEKAPQHFYFEYPNLEALARPTLTDAIINTSPWSVAVNGPIPQVHVLAQGKYSLMITSAGSGYSQWEDFALTRWQSDTTLDASGNWIYVQDREDGTFWSSTCQPTDESSSESMEAIFSPHQVELRRKDHDLTLHTEITVADGVEIRRVTILNDSARARKLRLVSYGEVVLAPHAIDQHHPAFNKLFIESEYIAGSNALLFRRRLRSADEKAIFLAHALVMEPGQSLTREYETSRSQFIGRAHTQRSPLALQGKEQQLSGTLGSSLDPIFSLAQNVDLLAHTRIQLVFLTVAASTRAETINLLTAYQSRQAVSRAFENARIESRRELLALGLNSYDLEHTQRLLSALLYPVSTLRAPQHVISRNTKGQWGLQAYGISGDYPILLVRLHTPDSPLLAEALQAYIYWRNQRVKTNLVILDEQDTGYAMDVHNQVMRQLARRDAEIWLNQRDGIFVLQANQVVGADRGVIETAAGVILDDRTGTLVDHAKRLSKQPMRLSAFMPTIPVGQAVEPTPRLPRPMNLLMDNGLGGFSPDGREYVMYLKPGQHTPHPWINVIANPQFGFLVSEAGAGCTWAENSSENRLTPWRNDPVTDMPGEAVYLRDEETGVIWSPTPMPVEATVPFLIRHGAGYSVFEHQSHGLNHRLRLFAALDTPVKIVHLKVENLWNRPRNITVTYYAEWVLGTTREATQMHIVPDFDPMRHALLASNRYSASFGERVAFLAASKTPHGVTADRSEFLGRMGSLQAPAALGRTGLASKVTPGLDPCAALQLKIDLAPGESEEIFFLIGQGADRNDSLSIIGSFQSAAQVETAWQAVHQHWDDILGAVTVQTPDSGMDLLLNRWSLYQTLACRVWGRTALYQSSGAFGFRDQLQDVLALLHARPDLARQQILNAARHQFDAGDVLHWWNPPSGKGVRTRFSDDLLWLPYVTAEYVQVTGDVDILHQKIPFLQGAPLGKDEIERYAVYESTLETYSLYEHCRRAIEKGSTAGIHGLPLMGAGDWNDGMNRVGIGGQGESIWLGWFLHTTLKRFAALREWMGDDPMPYHKQAAALVKAIETYGWDGEWYKRAFYDDGTPLGSSTRSECKIDSIAQSWAVLSDAANTQHAEQAMESVFQILVKQNERMVLLFTPPLDKTAHDPGYIKGYAPGVRENGGQYTHAAIWAVWAFAKLGQGGRAEALFRLLNPIHHADTPTKVARYKVEPYVIAADVYSEPPHVGNGGWTWYTGSAGWMYRLGIEAILGISRQGDKLKVDPCIPKIWPRFKVSYRFGHTRYQISVDNPENVNRGVVQVLLDGKIMADHLLPLIDDGHPHDVHVVMGSEHEMLVDDEEEPLW